MEIIIPFVGQRAEGSRACRCEPQSLSRTACLKWDWWKLFNTVYFPFLGAINSSYTSLLYDINDLFSMAHLITRSRDHTATRTDSETFQLICTIFTIVSDNRIYLAMVVIGPFMNSKIILLS